METPEQSKQISKYNDAVLSISRLNESWIRCNLCMRKGNFAQWKYELDGVWLELYPDVVRGQDKDTLIEENDKYMKLISKAKNKRELFFRLMERHGFLREVQDLAGKAGVYRDEDEEAFE